MWRSTPTGIFYRWGARGKSGWSGKEGVSNNSGRGRGMARERERDEHSVCVGMLAHLSRNGLSMLAGGGANGGSFSLGVGMPSLRDWGSNGGGERAAGVSGCGFTGMSGYRAARVVSKTTTATTPRPSLMSPMGLRYGSQEETKVKDEAKAKDEAKVKDEAVVSSSHRGCTIGDLTEHTDVQKLTADECWKLILKLGTQWPAWNGTAKSSQATQGLMKENDWTLEASDHVHPSQSEERLQGKGKPVAVQGGQDFLKLLTRKALEALAQTPPDHHRGKAGGMLAPKQTTQEVMDSKAGDTPTKATETTPSDKAPSSSDEGLAPKTTSSNPPRTAALTIFYDGVVNVSNNVPEDKARLIMMIAEKAGISPNTEVVLRSVKCVTPSPQDPTPSTATSQEELHHSKRSSHDEDSASDQEPAESSNPAMMGTSEPSSLPRQASITSEGTNSRPQVVMKPLPNARKNSLARFLDSRKRGTASCFEGGPSKKRALGDRCCPNDSDQELKFTMYSQSCSNCTKASERADIRYAEMNDSFVE